MSIQIKYDPYGILYLRFSEAKIARSIEVVEDALVLDLDEKGRIVGIEASDPSALRLLARNLPPLLKLPEEAGTLDLEHLGQSFRPAGPAGFGVAPAAMV